MELFVRKHLDDGGWSFLAPANVAVATPRSNGTGRDVVPQKARVNWQE